LIGHKTRSRLFWIRQFTSFVTDCHAAFIFPGRKLDAPRGV
jgi:hypothetical protein